MFEKKKNIIYKTKNSSSKKIVNQSKKNKKICKRNLQIIKIMGFKLNPYNFNLWSLIVHFHLFSFINDLMISSMPFPSDAASNTVLTTLKNRVFQEIQKFCQ